MFGLRSKKSFQDTLLELIREGGDAGNGRNHFPH